MTKFSFPLFLLLAASGAISPAAAETADGAFRPGLAAFSLEVSGEVNPYEVFFATALPGQEVPFRLLSGEAVEYSLTVDAGDILCDVTDSRFRWKAPNRPGHSVLSVLRNGEEMTIHLFVMRPAAEMRDGILNGYTIGRYPAQPYQGKAIYERPRGFIEVDESLAQLPVSPHFRLGQFLCNQRSDWPKYMLLRPRLVLKLEFILAELNAKGRKVDTLSILSGFRTPYYNEAIDNVPNSRHLWGGAADIYVDFDPVDGVMDDWDGDGRSTIGDARVLGELIDRMGGDGRYRLFFGGKGEYGANGAHGPFVHIDVRGQRVRW